MGQYCWTMWPVVAQRSHCISVHLMRLAYTIVDIMRMLVWSAVVSKFVLLYGLKAYDVILDLFSVEVESNKVCMLYWKSHSK